MASSTDIEWEGQRWIYLGRRWASGKAKLYHAFIQEAEDVAITSDGEMYFDQAPRWASIGSIYVIETNGSQARVRGGEHSGRFDDEQAIQSWRVMDRSAAVEQEGVRAQKRLQAQNSEIGKLTLSELRNAMMSQPSHVQSGTLVTVMRYLTRGT